MTQVTINGNTYSDDGSTAKDMRNGGHRTHFIPLCSDVATVAGQVQNNADQVAIDAVNAADGANAVRGTSTTSTAVGAGTKTFTTQAGKQFTGGNYVTVSRTSAPATLMHGVVTSYSGTALTVDVSTIAGSGTFADWTIALSGAQGVQGPSGNGVMPYSAKTGAYTVVTTDRGSLIDCTSGTFTLAFQACATLGSDWSCYIRNSGTGVITLDPNGAETIDGGSTYDLSSGHAAFVQCDGSGLRVVYDIGLTQTRHSIFSTAAAAKTGVTVLEDIAFPAYTTGLTGSVTQAIYGNNLFLALSGTSQANIASSPDAITWTLRAMPSAAVWVTGTNGTDKFIANPAGTTTIAKSINGTTWTAGTALPSASSGGGVGRPAFNGAVCIIFTNTSAMTSGDNGATWAAQTLPANPGSNPFVIGGLFWYWTSGTTAYTSATGATGSWTARTLPVTPGAYTHKTPTGALSISVSGAGSIAYETTDGINWTSTGVASPTGIPPIKLNTVPALLATTFGDAGTYHNGAWVRRTASVAFYPDYQFAVGGSGVVCFPANTRGVMRFDPANASTPTAIFEG